MIEMSRLQGLSVDKAELFGKPNVGCEYTGYESGAYHVLDGARCVVCGSYHPLNAHHVCPRSVRHVFVLGGRELRSPLMCLCGSGTQGCHGMLHAGRFAVRWEWDSDESMEAWWSGELLDRHGPHSDELYKYGRYLITDRMRGFDMTVRGNPYGRRDG